MNARRLEKYGPWAVVTGASDGIGREFARSLAADGFKLVLVARREAQLRALAAELPTEARVLALDLSRDEDTRALAAAAAQLDVGLLVAAAGFGTSGAFLEQHLGDELSMIDVNVRAVASLSHHLGRQLVKRGRGGIILFSSLLAFQGVPRAANYAATKAWVQTFAEGLAIELAPLGVDVLASAPGPIRTGFEARANMKMSMALEPSAVARASLDALPGRGTVRPGWLSKFLEWSLMFLPRWGRVRALQQVMAGMTKHQGATLPP
jgi:short-subunit dehydrogenase